MDENEKEDARVTIAKISAAVGVLTACYSQNWGGVQSDLVEAAAEYLKRQFES